MTTTIRGGGIAAHCCERLLLNHGIQVRVEPSERPKQPAIMLGPTTQKLLQDIFERDLFEGFIPIAKRVVQWAEDDKPLELAHTAIVATEEALLERLAVVPWDGPQQSADWTVFASQPLPENVVEHHFGARIACAIPVSLEPRAEQATCWIESMESGWLFLVPVERKQGWLLSIGESALDHSRLVARQISAVGETRGRFPCHPRIADPVCGPRFLACGSAVMGVDPLCGEGAGYAAREAILAAAVIRASAEGAQMDALLTHYRVMLQSAFARHLQACVTFYRGRHGPWWQDQLQAVQKGLSWCAEQLAGQQERTFRLNGFTLEAIPRLESR